MKDRLIVFGFGLDFACAAAMAKLRFPRAELTPVSTSYLLRFLEQQAEAPQHRNIIILGLGLGRDPERLGAALQNLKSQAIRVLWISVLSPPALPESVLDNIEIALGGGWLCEYVGSLLGTPRNPSAAARIMRLLDERETSEDLAWIELLEGAITVFTRQRKPQVLVDAVKSLIRGEMSPAQRRLQVDYHENGDLEIKGRSPATHELKETARRVAESKVFCVLLEGECGTDSHLLARFIHDNSAFADQPYQHRYAGAIASEQALCDAWQAAADGSLVLANIDDLAPSIQGSLLALLDMRSPQPKRLIVTTHRSLYDGAHTGFRSDLYWRITGMRLTLPPLRNRPRDIALLANDFALSSGRKRLPPRKLQLLEAYDWPGNAVQLRGFLERMFALGDADWDVELASESMRHPSVKRDGPLHYVLVPCEGARLQDAVHAHVRAALDLHDGNKTRCARTLGISVNTLKRHLKAETDR